MSLCVASPKLNVNFGIVAAPLIQQIQLRYAKTVPDEVAAAAALPLYSLVVQSVNF